MQIIMHSVLHTASCILYPVSCHNAVLCSTSMHPIVTTNQEEKVIKNYRICRPIVSIGNKHVATNAANINAPAAYIGASTFDPP